MKFFVKCYMFTTQEINLYVCLQAQSFQKPVALNQILVVLDYRTVLLVNPVSYTSHKGLLIFDY